MMKLAALTLLASAGCAAAFAPATPVLHRTAANVASKSQQLSMSFENELGVQPPLGFWDPLNFVYNVDQQRFDRLREVEIKHGRIAMLAVLGHITTAAGYRLGPFVGMKSGLAGLSDIPTFGIIQIVALIGFLEVFIMKGKGEFPGDYRNGIDFGWSGFSEEEKLEKRAIELNQGRAAQMGILGLMVHEKLTGDPYIINQLLGYPSHFNEGL